jgi:hypothetical protein
MLIKKFQKFKIFSENNEKSADICTDPLFYV